MLPITIGRASRSSPRTVQISTVGKAVFLICEALGIASSVLYKRPEPALIALVIGLYFLFAIRVAEQWEKAAVLRLGRYIGLRGPGMFMIVPVIDHISVYVDQRTRVVQVSAETHSPAILCQ